MKTTKQADSDRYEQPLHGGGYLDQATLRRLSKVSPWRGVIQIAIEWFWIATAIMLFAGTPTVWLYPLLVVWVGARQNALAVLMHEAAHFRLLPIRIWNEWVGEIFCAWPVLITVNGYRQTHFPHHHHVNRPNDPDWLRKQGDPIYRYPKSAAQVLAIMTRYLLGLQLLREAVGFQQESRLPARVASARLVSYAVVLTLSVRLDLWLGLVLYWIVPLSTYFLWAVYVRGVAEHFGGIEHGEGLLEITRHVEANFAERVLVAPNNISIHVAHHLYPSVPFYRLRELHVLLMQKPEYRQRVHISHGYLAMFRKCVVSDRPTLLN